MKSTRNIHKEAYIHKQEKPKPQHNAEPGTLIQKKKLGLKSLLNILLILVNFDTGV